MTTPTNNPKGDEELYEQIATVEVYGHQLQNYLGSRHIEKLVALIQSRERAARLDQVHKDLSGYRYTMPIKSSRTRNTAFKLYAVKFFNGVIAKRREQAINQLKSEEK